MALEKSKTIPERIQIIPEKIGNYWHRGSKSMSDKEISVRLSLYESKAAFISGGKPISGKLATIPLSAVPSDVTVQNLDAWIESHLALTDVDLSGAQVVKNAVKAESDSQPDIMMPT